MAKKKTVAPREPEFTEEEKKAVKRVLGSIVEQEELDLIREISEGLHGIVEILKSGSLSDLDGVEVANALRPIDNRLCDLLEVIAAREGLGAQ